jgi:uncharacterized protein
VAGAAWWAPVDGGGGITVAVRVTPGARRSEVLDVAGGRLRVRVAAPAVEGKANAELERFLADVFGVRRTAVAVVRGGRGREKTVRIDGVEGPPPDLPVR